METNNGIKKFGYGIFLMFGAVLIPEQIACEGSRNI